MSETRTFDPGAYLTKVGSSDYLEVKWRLVWFRQEHPDASIETELVSHADRLAIFRAKISVPGGGNATGFGSEGFEDFRDYIEKAETKAIGRALAGLGYGTQFCPDFDFSNGGGRIVDSPIDFNRTRGRRNTSPVVSVSKNPIARGTAAHPNQIKSILAIAREQKRTEEQIDDEMTSLYGKRLAEIDSYEAGEYITKAQRKKSVAAIAS